MGDSYTTDILKFISGKKYAGSNIQTSDGITAYVTSTGIAKTYPSVNNLSNLNGCKNTFERIDTKWEDLGIPTGSLMVEGQSCGNETKYLQSNPPKINFDWQFYINSNPDLNLTTEQQAKDHWETSGMHQGLLPNKNILTSMANVGKIGYVNVNTVLQNVPQEAYNYKGTYKSFDNTHITGSTMQDCSRKVPSVKYGDQLYIQHDDKFGSINQQSILEFGTTKTNLFLRPPVGTDALSGNVIKYGDQVNISISSSNVYTNDCGWWGCKVGYVNPTNSVLSFGPGGQTGGKTFTINVPPGTNYRKGSEIKYGDPFSITIDLEYSDTLLQGEPLTQGYSRRSLNGKFFLFFSMGVLYLYNLSPANVIWSSSAPSQQMNGKAILGSDGNLIVYDYMGIPKWSSNTANKGESPYSLKVENTGNLVIYDAVNTQIWSTETNIPTTTDTTSDSRVGYVKNNTIVFENVQNTGKNIFTFQNITSTPYDTTCDINELQRNCNNDPTCTGFIHGEKTNTWQKMNYNASSANYSITDNPTKIYVKEATVDTKDESCEKGTPVFVDSDIYSNYPQYVNNGDLKVGGKNQCSRALNSSALWEKNMKHQNNNLGTLYKTQEELEKRGDFTSYTSQNNYLYNQIDTKTKEYKSVLSDIKNNKIKPTDTLGQHETDISLIVSTNKSNALLWGVSSIIIIAMVVILRNRQ